MTNSLTDWQKILWRERQHSNDTPYNRQLDLFLSDVGSIDWATRWRGRPLAVTVEQALEQGCQAIDQAQTEWRPHLSRLAEARLEAGPLTDRYVANLASPNWLDRFIARHMLVTLGGEAVPYLTKAIVEQQKLWDVVIWILHTIEFDTTARIFARLPHLLCPDCLIGCKGYRVDVARGNSIGYFGCRECKRSRDLLPYRGRVAVVLDRTPKGRLHQTDDELQANWFAHPVPFDFDRVLITKATDEDVERFAVKIGNDPYEPRQRLYKAVPCRVACDLSEDSLRILDQIFGRVTSQLQQISLAAYNRTAFYGRISEISHTKYRLLCTLLGSRLSSSVS